MTVEEFFAWQQDQEDRYELVDGIPVKMMAGASNFHDAIVTNIIAALVGKLRGGPCRTMTADTAVRTRIRGLRRPDVTVNCAPLKPDAYEAAEPRMVVEVLSPSNTGVQWYRKLEEYRRRQGLRYILLVDARVVQATLFTRSDTDWEPTDADGLEGVFDLPEIGCELTMREIYDGLSFEG